jgi:hypothetical protein
MRSIARKIKKGSAGHVSVWLDHSGIFPLTLNPSNRNLVGTSAGMCAVKKLGISNFQRPSLSEKVSISSGFVKISAINLV